MKKDNKGFSLIELIIAVAILVVLSGLLAPQLIKYIEKSREAKDKQAIDSVYVAVTTALADEEAYDDFVTKAASTTDSLKDIDDAGVLVSVITASTDKFGAEVKSILGKTDITLTSKRGIGTGTNAGTITVKVTSEGKVKAWATGASSTDVPDFTVGDN